MTETFTQPFPASYLAIDKATRASGFTMASEPLTCSLLRTLAQAKPAGAFLELGTGTGLSTAWILDGMDRDSTIVSVDNDQRLLRIAKKYLGQDNRLTLVQMDGGEWISKHRGQQFDYIFADTWHGKFLLLDEALGMLRTGGLYIVDDLLPQRNWPDGHQEKVNQLIRRLEQRDDLLLTKLHWATGIIIAAKR